MQVIIFLDFDGVLFNTVKEAYAVSMISSGRCKKIEDLNFNSVHYREFLRYRYLVSSAWNYKYVLKLLDSEKYLNFIDAYWLMCKEAKKSEYIEFEKSFFRMRAHLKKINFERWLELSEPYHFLGLIKKLLTEKSNKFRIVTTKDKATAEKLLKVNGINFNVNHIYDKEYFEKYKSKANIIVKLMNFNKTTKSIFVDDNENHLKGCENIGNMLLYQADWGYVSSNGSYLENEKTIFTKIKGLMG